MAYLVYNILLSIFRRIKELSCLHTTSSQRPCKLQLATNCEVDTRTWDPPLATSPSSAIAPNTRHSIHAHPSVLYNYTLNVVFDNQVYDKTRLVQYAVRLHVWKRRPSKKTARNGYGTHMHPHVPKTVPSNTTQRKLASFNIIPPSPLIDHDRRRPVIGPKEDKRHRLRE